MFRHGESEGNRLRIIQGHTNYPLSDNGVKQAIELANWFITSNYNVSAIYSSDLTRAAETAVIIAKTLNKMEINFDKRLREFNLGIFEGRKVDSLTQVEKEFRDSHWENEDKKIPEGESVRDMKTRVKEAFEEIRCNHSDNETVMIVAHGGTLYHILISTLGFNMRETLEKEWFGNCQRTELKFDSKQEEWSLVTFNNKPYILKS
jgi:broad specificity phosphatase PhoE